LFRSFWYITLLSSLFSRHQTRKTKSSLESIAKRAPPLVLSGGAGGVAASGSGDVWVEIEAQINGALKNSPGGMSVEAVRGDLASAIPSQAGSARSVSAAQAVFLTTVLRLETLRAETGVVSPIFEYFKIPSLAKEAGMGDCLKSIGEKVS
jgi:phosphatidylinositol 4-kinase